MKIIKNYFAVIYLIFLITILISNFWEFKLVSQNAIVAGYVVYFLITIIGLFSLYRSEKPDVKKFILLLLPFIALFTSGPIFRLTPLIGTLPLFFLEKNPHKDIDYVFKVVYVTVFFIAVLITALVIMFGDLGKITILETINSPDGNYQLISRNHNEGALGGATTVTVERVYFGIAGRSYRQLYYGHWGEHPEIKWLDNRKVLINGRKMDICDDPTWVTKTK